MAHKTLVVGTAYDTLGGKCLVGGTGYGIKKGRTLVGGTGYDINFSAYDPVFANNTWAEIIAACQEKKVPDTWAVGNTKAMTIGGSDYAIAIIGKNHDDYADGSGKAPLTLQMVEVYTGTYRMHSNDKNTSGWNACYMRNTVLPTVLSNMPSEVQSGIRSVNKLTLAEGMVSTIETAADGLFLLSAIEILSKVSYSATGEGSRYAYYANGGSGFLNLASSRYHWTRSPNKDNTTSYISIRNDNGSARDASQKATTANSIAPAFCF